MNSVWLYMVQVGVGSLLVVLGVIVGAWITRPPK